MHNKLFLIIGLFFVIVFSGCIKKNDRYELKLSSKDAMMLDKQEGTVWYFYQGEWVNIGNPPKEAPQKGDTVNIHQPYLK